MPYETLVKEAQTLVANMPYERLQYLVAFLKTETEPSLYDLIQEGLVDAENGREEPCEKVFSDIRAELQK